MITYTLEAILAIFLVIVLMRLFRKDPKAIEPPAYQAPVEDLANLKVTDARTGDVLSIAGALLLTALTDLSPIWFLRG